jgi:hypothetical protein
MKEIARLRELEADCRRRAQSEPERQWYWLAQAARYQTEANFAIPETSDEPDAPDVKLASWPIRADERRLHKPFRPAPGFCSHDPAAG